MGICINREHFSVATEGKPPCRACRYGNFFLFVPWAIYRTNGIRESTRRRKPPPASKMANSASERPVAKRCTGSLRERASEQSRNGVQVALAVPTLTLTLTGYGYMCIRISPTIYTCPLISMRFTQISRPLQTTADHCRPLQTTADHCRPLQTTADRRSVQICADLHRSVQICRSVQTCRPADHCRPLQTSAEI